MKKRFRTSTMERSTIGGSPVSPIEGPQRRNGTAALRDNASKRRMAEPPSVPLDWKGVLQRVQEEFGAGRCPDGLQKTFA